MSGAAPGPLPPGQRRDALIAEVRRGCRALPDGAVAIVAASGGPDSCALAHLVQEARPDLALHLGHVRHGLRDDRGDVAAVGRTADALGVPVHVLEVTVEPSGQGLEAAARAARYAALRRLSRELDATSAWLLVGHTADDQAETLLLRMARGTGITGLGGMAQTRGGVVRPLLRVRREDVRRFVTLEGLDVVQDPMNTDARYRRVRARHEVLPLLERLAPDPVGALGRLADLARADARHLDGLAAGTARSAVRRYGPGRAVPTDVLGSLSPAIARRLVRLLVVEISGGPPPSADHVAAILALGSGQAVDLQGVTATCGGGWLALIPDDLSDPAEVGLSVPGETRWRPGLVTVTAAVAGPSTTGQLALPLDLPWAPPRVEVPASAVPPGGDPDLGQVVLSRAVLGAPLALRSRRPGDRVSTHVGTRKLQDVFVDAGVPRALRDTVPVLTAGERIVWVPGVVADADALAEGRSAPYLHLAVDAS
ncbi:MAG: tRNA lysidine(34) synthetase TilS [Actinobacteria bacterium]|nr:tRNA lysidine(34) synthetase TilS [Actinomycetota bacterium]